MIGNNEEDGNIKKNIKEFSKMRSIDDITSKNQSVTSKTKSQIMMEEKRREEITFIIHQIDFYCSMCADRNYIWKQELCGDGD
jgi:hypothetical protein